MYRFFHFTSLSGDFLCLKMAKFVYIILASRTKKKWKVVVRIMYTKGENVYSKF